MSAGAGKPGKPGTPGTPAKGFGALAALRDQVPARQEAAPPAAAAAAAKAKATEAPKGPARAVVRLERKGRGGKEATIVEKLELAPAELERWCKELKSALGCGGAVDGPAIVLQGDLRKRLESLLVSRGVRKVTVG
ncbi:MAG TPA: translation initiation factor [Kofleriaceae bacterium]|nr:translation initiation factor [Kofleriaceae bacterium]